MPDNTEDMPRECCRNRITYARQNFGDNKYTATQTLEDRDLDTQDSEPRFLFVSAVITV